MAKKAKTQSSVPELISVILKKREEKRPVIKTEPEEEKESVLPELNFSLLRIHSSDGKKELYSDSTGQIVAEKDLRSGKIKDLRK